MNVTTFKTILQSFPFSIFEQTKHTMKHLFTILAFTIGFSMNAQLAPVTEGGNTGQRLSTSNAANHGNIGSNAVDLSYSDSSSTTRGASGDYSTAMGFGTLASGNYSTAMGYDTEANGTLSTVMGYSTTASDYGSLVVGRYNLSGATVTNSATDFNTANTAFVIGNGINQIYTKQ
jgi:hypothetical protein